MWSTLETCSGTLLLPLSQKTLWWEYGGLYSCLSLRIPRKLVAKAAAHCGNPGNSLKDTPKTPCVDPHPLPPETLCGNPFSRPQETPCRGPRKVVAQAPGNTQWGPWNALRRSLKHVVKTLRNSLEWPPEIPIDNLSGTKEEKLWKSLNVGMHFLGLHSPWKVYANRLIGRISSYIF